MASRSYTAMEILKELESVLAWHSSASVVHHVCDRCDLGDNIGRRNQIMGTGNKPLCSRCREV